MIDSNKLQPVGFHALKSAPLCTRFHPVAHRAFFRIGDALRPLHPLFISAEQSAGFKRGAAADVPAHRLPGFTG